MSSSTMVSSTSMTSVFTQYNRINKPNFGSESRFTTFGNHSFSSNTAFTLDTEVIHFQVTACHRIVTSRGIQREDGHSECNTKHNSDRITNIYKPRPERPSTHNRNILLGSTQLDEQPDSIATEQLPFSSILHVEEVIFLRHLAMFLPHLHHALRSQGGGLFQKAVREKSKHTQIWL